MSNFDMGHLHKFFITDLKKDQNILKCDYPTKKQLKNLYKQKLKSVEPGEKEKRKINDKEQSDTNEMKEQHDIVPTSMAKSPQDDIPSTVSVTKDSLLPDQEATLIGSQTTEADHRHKEAAKKTRKEKTRALILAVENMDEDFNYIDSQRNNEVLDDMYERKRRDNIDKNARRRIEALTEEDIRIEIVFNSRYCQT